MYDNISKKICVLAMILGGLSLIAGAIAFIIIFGTAISNDELTAICLIPIAAGVTGFFSSWVLYGFGQLLENSSNIRETLKKLAEDKPAPSKKDDPSDELPDL